MTSLRHSGRSEFLEGLALGFYTTWGLILAILVYVYCYHNEWFQYYVLWKQKKVAAVKQTDKYYV